jgi:hypothetical protein
MPRIVLTAITIRNLNSDRQTRYRDAMLLSLGLLVGKRCKTFILRRGKERKITTRGTFPRPGRCEQYLNRIQGSRNHPHPSSWTG